MYNIWRLRVKALSVLSEYYIFLRPSVTFRVWPSVCRRSQGGTCQIWRPVYLLLSMFLPEIFHITIEISRQLLFSIAYILSSIDKLGSTRLLIRAKALTRWHPQDCLTEIQKLWDNGCSHPHPHPHPHTMGRHGTECLPSPALCYLCLLYWQVSPWRSAALIPHGCT